MSDTTPRLVPRADVRILWVKVGGLWPLTAGGRIRSFHTISELARRHRVTILTTHGPGEDPDALAARLPHCEGVTSYPYTAAKRGGARFIAAVARSWPSSLPVDLWKWRVPALRHAVGELLATGDFDLCVADFLFAVPNLPRISPVPVVLFEHNVEHLIWKRLARTAPPWQRPLVEIEWRKMRRYERRACTKASLTIAVSEPDRALLATIAPEATVRATPTGVDTAYFATSEAPELDERLVFTGAMDWFPNEDAILYLIDRILPLIRDEIPQSSLTIVGRNPSARIRTAAAGAGVEVTGTVDDVRPYVAEAAVVVIPMRVGGGTRLKIFEALAMSKAVVSTSVGAEGLPLTPEEHYLLADDPGDFARAVVSLMRDPSRRVSLGAAGHALVSQRYSWTQAAAEFEACCTSFAARQEPCSGPPKRI